MLDFSKNLLKSDWLFSDLAWKRRSDCYGSHLFAVHLSDFQLRSHSGHHGWKKFQTYQSLDFTLLFLCPSFQLRSASRWKNVGAEKFGGEAEYSLKQYFTAVLQAETFNKTQIPLRWDIWWDRTVPIRQMIFYNFRASHFLGERGVFQP